MAFLVYIFAFSICVWIGVNAGKIKHYATGLFVAGLMPFVLVFVFHFIFQLMFPNMVAEDSVNPNSLATVLFAFLATPGSIIALVVFHMARNQQKHN
ncbi:hypothetical protein CWE08_00350 [Aliidiomarina iranensis]|uniref:Uncharacterized protein n=1 Tax=Aliidiomarina iranensis TaxID=1434071 RepID=A0A432W1N9_9GAMM|nr:hypothetical protein [Aliidiomarina iranensis]RUO23140.1 hypothetical protein CWE08_00350 [Aliidiomarina iranensis]